MLLVAAAVRRRSQREGDALCGPPAYAGGYRVPDFPAGSRRREAAESKGRRRVFRSAGLRRRLRVAQPATGQLPLEFHWLRSWIVTELTFCVRRRRAIESVRDRVAPSRQYKSEELVGDDWQCHYPVCAYYRGCTGYKRPRVCSEVAGLLQVPQTRICRPLN